MDAEDWAQERARRRDPNSEDARRWRDGIEQVRAESSARRNPMTSIGRDIARATTGKRGSGFREIALSLGAKVRERLRATGAQTDDELSAMEARMREWVEVVIRHTKDEQKLWANEGIPLADRVQLVRQMRDSLREIRVETFGE